MDKNQEHDVLKLLQELRKRQVKTIMDLLEGKITPKEAKARTIKQDAELAKLKGLMPPRPTRKKR